MRYFTRRNMPYRLVNISSFTGLIIASWLLAFFTASPAIAETPPQLFVTIEGVNGREATNVRNLLGIHAYHRQNAPGASRVRFLHNRAERDIFRALTPYGYYRIEVDSSLEQRDGDWHAHYRIQPGQPIPIGQVNIEFRGDAANDPQFTQLRQSLALRSGARLRHSEYEASKSRIRNLAAERGYYQARFVEQELRIDLDRYQADIHLIFDSGPRYRFGEVRISEGHLDEDVMRRFIGFESGDLITSNELLMLQLGMSDSDYFSRVEVQPLWGEADEDFQVPVVVEYEPNQRTFYQTGFGYGTDTGPRISFEQNRRWVNTRGHRYQGLVQLSEIKTNVGASYIIPGQRPQTDQYAIRGAWVDENTSNTRSERLTLGVSWQKQLTRTQRIVALDWLDERDRIDGERRNSEFLLPSVQWSRVHAENRLNVSDGFRLSLTLRGAAESLLSDTDFSQAHLAAKTVIRLSDRVRFLTRGDLGISASEDFSKVPTSLRFYAGGDTSIRGYGYRSIGPRNELGEVLGARHLLVGSVEFDYEFRPNMRWAVFLDSGNAFNDITEPMRTGAGIGYRWQSPIGPIRVDLAHGFSYPGDRIRLHLTIGPDL
ncbi:autotransporter assembly complex protein TamA [Aliidiomarina haloalkalitolerans]|uniref:Translocation and assembly module subunit TamA n=1 Tax=Aliidiomarina haloalkalitolerans TaxID=859059 RepID=A0A432VR80_9GAMM|nr:autotransporter assembly complex family protein [Aliidiomarina haloalkalitolerans]RUO18822.1 outer membrane protein assembly factor [Aliidiomarina haloalkalitolerans]